MKTITRLNSSRALVLLILAAIFIIMLYCNFLTPLQGDDYCYMYSCKDNGPIENVWDVVESMYYHRFTTNGRVIPHFFATLSLTLLPIPLFKVVNALFFTLYIFLVYSFALRFSAVDGKEHNAVLLCAVMAVTWVMSPEFASVFLWQDGSCNYLWCELVVLLWLAVMCRDYIEDISMKPWQEILFALLCLAVGNYAENSSVASVFMMMLFMALSLFYKKRPLKRWHISALCAMLIGFFLLALAPAELETKIAAPSFTRYLNSFIWLVRTYLSFWPLIVFYLLCYTYSLRHGKARDTRVLTLVFMGGSMASHFILLFALYPSERSVHIAMSFLLLSCALLFYELFDADKAVRRLLCLASAALMCLTAYWGYVGIQDLRLVHYRWEYNDNYIKEQAAAGETHIRVPYIIPDTRYSVFYVWGYIREDNSHYFNTELAKYHGVEEISGYWLYDTES